MSTASLVVATLVTSCPIFISKFPVVVGFLCLHSVHQDNLSLLRHTARRVRIQNDDPTWNCQDFVWTLLEALVEADVIDGDDEIYTTGRQMV